MATNEQIEERTKEIFEGLCYKTDFVSEATGPDGFSAHKDYPAGVRFGAYNEKQLAFDDRILQSLGLMYKIVGDPNSPQHFIDAANQRIGEIITDHAVPYIMSEAVDQARNELEGTPKGGGE